MPANSAEVTQINAAMTREQDSVHHAGWMRRLASAWFHAATRQVEVAGLAVDGQ